MLTFLLLAFGGISLMIFLLFRTKEGGFLAATLKLVTSFLFVATAVSAVVNNYGITGLITTKKLTYFGLVILGLVCGLIGDFTLDLKITYKDSNIRHSDIYTYIGMAAFGVGHIFYIVAVSLFFGFSAWTILIAAGVTAAIFCTSLFLLKMNFGKFLIPSVLYAFLLTMFLACAAAAGILTCCTAAVSMLIAGAALFLASDLVLSMIYFDGREARVLIIVNHVLYYAAQFLIALSLYYTGLPL